MDQHSFSVLEFEVIKRILKEIVFTPGGEYLVENIIPFTNLEEIDKVQRETTEMREIIQYEGSLPLEKLEEVNKELKKSEVDGFILEAHQILKILKVLVTARQVKQFLLRSKEKYPLIREKTNQINVFPELEKEINYCIGEDGVVLDQASLELKRIRREITKKEQIIKKQLESILHSAQFSNIIQEPIITVRQGRYVIPIKQEKKGRFPGIVHDRSDSGITLFVEPLEVLELNNSLRQLLKEEEQEVLKVLLRITALIGAKAQEIRDSIKHLGEIDFIHARAILGNRMLANEPKLNDRGYINLIKARHPLLKEEKVVPIDIRLGENFNILLITGPNTGGKTVTLKTVGLLSLMAQIGLHLPAARGSEVSIFRKIFCDIGDEQSIEQNLSTFSSHMKYIVQILKEADSQSLVLLDELGAGTDPTEGAALGMAILDYLNQQRVRVIATTHHDSLKTYAYLTEGVSNARVEFDEKNLQPTFQISIGLPGKSCAFIIARRLGLFPNIVSKAQSFLTQEEKRAHSLIEEIEKDKREIERELKNIKITRDQQLEIKQEMEKELNEIKIQKEFILRNTYQEAQEVLKEVQDRAQKIIENLNQKRITYRKSKGLVLKDLQEIKEEVKGKLFNQIETVKTPELKVGDYVRIKKINQEGIVLSFSEKSGIYKVQVENMKISVPGSEIEKLEKAEEQIEFKEKNIIPEFKFSSNFYLSKAKAFSNTINLCQLKVEDATFKLEKYLDDAYLLGISPIYIIHGKGQGILRKAVRNFLNDFTYVQYYRSGDAQEGGSGVTVVFLKKQ